MGASLFSSCELPALVSGLLHVFKKSAHFLFEILQGAFDCIYIGPIILQRKIVSFSTLSRICQCRASGSATSTLLPNRSWRSMTRWPRSIKFRPGSRCTRRSRSNTDHHLPWQQSRRLSSFWQHGFGDLRNIASLLPESFKAESLLILAHEHLIDHGRENFFPAISSEDLERWNCLIFVQLYPGQFGKCNILRILRLH